MDQIADGGHIAGCCAANTFENSVTLQFAQHALRFVTPDRCYAMRHVVQYLDMNSAEADGHHWAEGGID